jgi:hypothetical protein
MKRINNFNCLKPHTEDIIDKYINSGETITSLGVIYNVYACSIHRLLKRNNVKIKDKSEIRRKYNVNSDYFKIIDSNEKAYFLGLLYADGNLSSTDYNVKISLIVGDVSILEKFKSNLNYDGQIKNIIYEDKGFKNQKLLCISNMYLHEDLIKLGCTPKKSLTLKFPSVHMVKEEFQSHFIRGYFDGDGSIFMKKSDKKESQRCVSFCGTEEFMTDIKRILTSKCQLRNNEVHKHIKSNAFYYKVGGNLQVDRIFGYLYKDANGLYLERKFNKFLKTNII